MIREIVFYKNHFLDFYEQLDEKAQEKIDYGLFILETQEMVPTSVVKHITNSAGIYEVRARVGTNQYRILFFFEEGDLISGGRIVVLINGFQKKSERDLRKALKKAEKIKQEYFEEKFGGDD